MLDHLLDRAIGAGDHAAVAQRVLRFEAEHDDRGRVAFVQPVEHPPHRLRANERNVAIEDEYVAVEVRQRCARLLHRVPRAELRFLQCGRSAPRDRRLDLLAPAADDDDGVPGPEFVDARHQVMQHRPSADRVEDLVQVALHPGALARGEDDGGEFACDAHGASPCHRLLAVGRIPATDAAR